MRFLGVDVTLYVMHCLFSLIRCCRNVLQQFAVQQRRLSYCHANVLSETPPIRWADCSFQGSRHNTYFQIIYVGYDMISLQIFVCFILCIYLHELQHQVLCQPVRTFFVFFTLSIFELTVCSLGCINTSAASTQETGCTSMLAYTSQQGQTFLPFRHHVAVTLLTEPSRLYVEIITMTTVY